MNMKHCLKLVPAAFLALASALSNAAGFEGSGTIEHVELGNNLLTVESEVFSLPNSTLLNDMPAIFQLKPGYIINFSGDLGEPYPIITSIYLFPESVLRVERGEQP